MAKKNKKDLTPEEKEALKKEAAERNRKRLENYNPVSAARNAWRREFSRSPVVIAMMNDPATKRHVPKFNKDGTRAKVDAVEHLCSECNQWKRSSKQFKVAIDHKVPVVDPEVGFVDFNTYFVRMWCDRSNLQKLCGECHQEKTNAEWFTRRYPEEEALISELEQNQDKAKIRKVMKRYNSPRLAKFPYPKAFLDRVESLKLSLKRK